MGFLTRCKRLFSFAFLLQNRNTFFSFFLKSFLILSEKQQLFFSCSSSIFFSICLQTFGGSAPKDPPTEVIHPARGRRMRSFLHRAAHHAAYKIFLDEGIQEDNRADGDDGDSHFHRLRGKLERACDTSRNASGADGVDIGKNAI